MTGTRRPTPKTPDTEPTPGVPQEQSPIVLSLPLDSDSGGPRDPKPLSHPQVGGVVRGQMNVGVEGPFGRRVVSSGRGARGATVASSSSPAGTCCRRTRDGVGADAAGGAETVGGVEADSGDGESVGANGTTGASGSGDESSSDSSWTGSAIHM